MKYESTILKRLIDTYGVVGNPRYISEIIKEFIVRGKELYPQLFTYQSDWLAHIDEFGLTPEYTVSYTGQHIYAPNTKEKPVKSAILKGQTLINIKGEPIILQSIFINNERKKEFLVPLVKPNTNYYIKYDLICANSDTVGISFLTNVNVVSSNKDLLPLSGSTILNSGNEPNYFRITGTEENSILTVNNLSIIEYREGMENWDIPYFTGMQSVKLPVLTTSNSTIKVEEFILGGTDSNGNITIDESGDNLTNFIKVSSNTKYTIKFNNFNKLSSIVVNYYDENRNFINRTINPANNVLTTPSNCEFVVIRFYSNPKLTGSIELYLTDNGYEPHKSNILSTPSDLELRGIGDVKDELNLLTGELTERIGYYKFTGDENFRVGNDYGDEIAFTIPTTDYITNPYFTTYGGDDSFALTTGFKFIGQSVHTGSTEESRNMCMSVHMNGTTYFRLRKDLLNTVDVDGFKNFIRNNPTKIVMKLSQKSIKTVDLTILDQNGQNVKQLMSFSGGTHFTTTSQDGSLLPTITVDVVTDLEETLKVCSLEGNTM